jgi:hypothetical protein
VKPLVAVSRAQTIPMDYKSAFRSNSSTISTTTNDLPLPAYQKFTYPESTKQSSAMPRQNNQNSVYPLPGQWFLTEGGQWVILNQGSGNRGSGEGPAHAGTAKSAGQGTTPSDKQCLGITLKSKQCKNDRNHGSTKSCYHEHKNGYSKP